MNIAATLVFASLLAGPAAASDDPPGGGPEGYGTATLSAYVIGSFDFQARVAALPLSATAGVDRFFNGTSAFADATFMLPNGAQIEGIELRACDTNNAAQVTAVFQVCSTPGGACALAASVQTGTAATPGCTLFPVAVTPPVIVDNTTQVLDVQVSTGPSAATSFSAVKVNYRLRVSPAPATATFPNDVPTNHPFFRFVEALAAAGITGGCGAGSYCPASPVSRGEMAVFLATALGLHFPN